MSVILGKQILDVNDFINFCSYEACCMDKAVQIESRKYASTLDERHIKNIVNWKKQKKMYETQIPDAINKYMTMRKETLGK